ncbi:MAG: hypothetical protein JWM33_745 [Caulobacteraceae bacterium]|nr:hypothetical protein [Caulobacteraceae bacterium]
MVLYRLYFLDASAQIRSAVDLSCNDDFQAKNAMAALADGRRMVLWRGEREVAQFHPHSEIIPLFPDKAGR